MVMERIHGVIVNDVEELRARGANIRKLAENGVEIFFTQVFRDNFFHADMHPGNIFVQIDDPAEPALRGRGFRHRRHPAGARPALSGREFPGLLRPRLCPGRGRCTSNRAGCRAAPGSMSSSRRCAPSASRFSTSRLKEISFAQVLLRLFETARRFDMQVQPQLILLQKTLFNIEGLGRQLYPELDLWQTAQPYLRRWMRERMSPRAVLRRVRAQLPDVLVALQAVPQIFQTAVREAAEGRLRVPVDDHRRGGTARRAAPQRCAARCDHRGGRALAVGSGLAGVLGADPLAGLAADERRHRALRRVADREAAAAHENSDRQRHQLSRPQFAAELAHSRGLCRRRAGGGRARRRLLARLSAAAGHWYAALAKPEWAPPNRWFGPVWLALYVLMGTSAWLIWRERYHRGRNAALGRLRHSAPAQCRLGADVFRRHEYRRRSVRDRRAVAGDRLDAARVRRREARRGLAAGAVLVWVSFESGLNLTIWKLNQ